MMLVITFIASVIVFMLAQYAMLLLALASTWLKPLAQSVERWFLNQTY